MISVGIDVSKGKSTVCIMKPYGEVIRSPYEVAHTINELQELSALLLHMDEEVKVSNIYINFYFYTVSYN